MIGCEGSDLNRRTLAYEASEVTRLLNPAIVRRRSHPSALFKGTPKLQLLVDGGSGRIRTDTYSLKRRVSEHC